MYYVAYQFISNPNKPMFAIVPDRSYVRGILEASRIIEVLANGDIPDEDFDLMHGQLESLCNRGIDEREGMIGSIQHRYRVIDEDDFTGYYGDGDGSEEE